VTAADSSDILDSSELTRFGLTGALLTAFAVIEGPETDTFRRMAERAGSLIPEEVSTRITLEVASRFSDAGNEGKPIYICNPHPLAKWLNLVLVATATYQPQRFKAETLAVDPFAGSLTAFDFVIKKWSKAATDPGPSRAADSHAKPNPDKSELPAMATEQDAVPPPKVFISYSWDSNEHKAWTKQLATRLRGDGIDVTLDQWSVVPGDQLPKFMETAIRENSYVVIICTPNYKLKSDERKGGVGYEGDIMTAEVLTERNDRKFIAVLRSGSWDAAMPSWLKGKYSINLSGGSYSEEQYSDLLVTLHNAREQPPAIGRPPRFKSIREEAKKFYPSKEPVDAPFDPVRIEGILADEAGRPANDGTRGSALYSIPFKLSSAPSNDWSDLFIHTWDHPPRYTTRHRPGIARVQGDRIILTRTTIEEVKDVHRDTLKLVVETVNQQIAEQVRSRRAAEEARQHDEQQHRDNIRKLADDISFD
jgi:hypothetical protein